MRQTFGLAVRDRLTKRDPLHFSDNDADDVAVPGWEIAAVEAEMRSGVKTFLARFGIKSRSALRRAAAAQYPGRSGISGLNDAAPARPAGVSDSIRFTPAFGARHPIQGRIVNAVERERLRGKVCC